MQAGTTSVVQKTTVILDSENERTTQIRKPDIGAGPQQSTVLGLGFRVFDGITV